MTDRCSPKMKAPAEPLSIEQYAAITAELAELGADRAAVLAGHNLTLKQWTALSNEWTGRLAADACSGGDLQNTFDSAFVATQDSLKPVPALSVDDWARIEREVRSKPAALANQGWSPQDWMRLCRHWARALAADRELAKAYASACHAVMRATAEAGESS